MSMVAADLIFPGDRVHLKDSKVHAIISDEERAARRQMEADRQEWLAREAAGAKARPEQPPAQATVQAPTPSESQASAPGESAPDAPPSGPAPG